MNTFEANKKALSPLDIRYRHFQDRTAEHKAVFEEKIRADIQDLFPNIWLDAQKFTKTADFVLKKNIKNRYALPKNGEFNSDQQMEIYIFTQACNLLIPPIK